MKALISSVTVHYGPRHDRVRVWNRGALAGELTVECGDGHNVAATLLPEHTRELDDGVAGRPDVTLRAIDSEELGAALDCLRILNGSVCWPCWEDHDRVTVATDSHGLCTDCYDAAAERQWESHCEDFYGGSGPSDRDRWEAARNSGRRA
jgi:hypothetical protein